MKFVRITGRTCRIMFMIIGFALLSGALGYSSYQLCQQCVSSTNTVTSTRSVTSMSTTTLNATLESELLNIPQNTTLISQYQTQALNYVGQLAIGHAALVFATLTAAFTFGTGFRKRLETRRAKLAYGSFLVVLFWGAVYALVRLVIYGLISETILNVGTPAYILSLNACGGAGGYLSNHTSIPPESFSAYWSCTVEIVSTDKSHRWLWPFISAFGKSSFLLCLWFAVFLTLVTFCLIKINPRKSTRNKQLVTNPAIKFVLCTFVGLADFDLNHASRDLLFFLLGMTIKVSILVQISYFTYQPNVNCYVLSVIIGLAMLYVGLLRIQYSPQVRSSRGKLTDWI